MHRKQKTSHKLIVSFILILTMLFSVAGFTLPVLADESSQQQISLNDAIQMALEHSDAVAKAEKEVDRTKDLRDLAGNQLGLITVGHNGTSAAESAYSNSLSADLNWQMSYKSLDQAKDALALSTCNQYWTLLQDQKIVADAEAGVASSLKKLQNARAAYRVGTGTNENVLSYEYAYQQAQATLASSKNDLDKAYNVLNQALGLQPDDRPILDPDVQYSPLVVTDLDHEISRVLESAPSIWKADQSIVIQRILHDVSMYSTGGSVYSTDAGSLAIEQTQLDVSSAKKTLSQATRSLYYATKNLEESIAASERSVKSAEETYRITQLKAQLGMATAADVANDAKTLSAAKLSYFKLICQHAYLKLEFEKPWAAGN